MTGSGGWVFAERARRDFARADRQTQRRIIQALDRLVEDPRGLDTKKLAGREREWRLRVGDWRVRFTRRQDTVLVLRVLPRGRAYRD